MTFGDKVIQVVKDKPGATDREITDILKGKAAHQSQVYQATNLLARKGLLVREKRPDGKMGNYLSGREAPVRVPLLPQPLAPRNERSQKPSSPLKATPEGNVVVCISCVKSKQNRSAKARDLYVSALFTKMLFYAESLRPKKIYILSAQYGLLNLDDVVEPYERTLKTMSVAERKLWAESVLQAMREEVDLQEDPFVFLAGMPYRENLMPHIRHCSVPMEGLSFGRQLQWLDEQLR